MKSPRKIAALGTTLLLAASAHSRAQSADKMYLDVAAGGAIQQNATVKVTPLGNGGDIKFDTGLRTGLKVGYDFNRSFAAEFETGVIWNSVDSIQNNKLSADGASGDLYQIPLLVNGIYKFPRKGPFTPYVGAGVGAAVGLFCGSNIPGLYFPGGNTGYSSTDVSFAYQAEAGFKYSVAKSVDLGLAYQFLGTTGYSWYDNSAPLKIGGTMTHAVLATFTWRF